MNRLIAFIAVSCAVRADTLEEILKRMDTEAKKFQSFSAKLKQVEYTAVLKQSSESTGEIRIKRTKSGLIGLVTFNAPEDRIIHFAGGKVEIFYPKAKTEDIYDVGKYQGEMDHWLALGFGTSGADLAGARELTSEQLSQAFTDAATILPNGQHGPYLRHSGAEKPVG